MIEKIKVWMIHLPVAGHDQALALTEEALIYCFLIAEHRPAKKIKVSLKIKMQQCRYNIQICNSFLARISNNNSALL